MVPVLVLLAASGGAGLGERMAAVAGQTPGRIGAAVLLIESGEHAAWHGRGRFPMQSVYKFPIAMAVLRDVDRGTLALDQSVRIDAAEMVPLTLHSPIRDRHPGGTAMTLAEVLRYAVTESDGTASDVLLRLVGGPARVTAYLEELGVRGVRVVTTEREMSVSEPVQYRNWAQPEEVAALLRLFWQGRGLSAASRARLLEWMTVTSTGPRRIRGLLPQGAPVAHKTGTSNTSHGLTPATNDVGIVTLPDGRHLAIAVFVADSPADTEAREAAIARIARAAWDWALEQR